MANPKLSREDIDKIVIIICTWRSKPFTWDLLVSRIEAELEITISRQALSGSSKGNKNYPTILKTYRLQKQMLKSLDSKRGTKGGLEEQSKSEKQSTAPIRA